MNDSSKNIRIAMDCRKIADFGIGTYIRGLLRGLSSLESATEYLVIAPASAQGAIPRDPRFTHIADDSPHYSIRELVSIGRLAARLRADLLHAPHYVVPFTNLPLVTTIHDITHLEVPSSQLPAGGRSYAAWMIGRAVRKSRRVIVPSAAVREDLTKRFDRAEKKVEVVALGVDPDRYRPDDAEAPPLNLIRHRYFLYVGNDKPHKNLDSLVAAFRRIHERRDDLRLVIAGAAVERYSGTAGVECPGFVDEVLLASLYRHALAVVMPSRFEGFGLPVLEAMASGAATVVSDIPALRELAGDAALTVDPSSIDSIESALARLDGDGTLRTRLAREGLRRSTAYRWSECARRTLAIWLEALGS